MHLIVACPKKDSAVWCYVVLLSFQSQMVTLCIVECVYIFAKMLGAHAHKFDAYLHKGLFFIKSPRQSFVTHTHTHIGLANAYKHMSYTQNRQDY